MTFGLRHLAGLSLVMLVSDCSSGVLESVKQFAILVRVATVTSDAEAHGKRAVATASHIHLSIFVGKIPEGGWATCSAVRPT